MASTFACIGLDLDEAGVVRLLDTAFAAAEPLAEVHGVQVRRWTDPSGARLIFAARGAELLDLQPSFAAAPGARLAGVGVRNGQVVAADVLDEDGQQVTALTAALEQFRQLAARRTAVSGAAAIAAFGVEVSLHESAEAFAASPASVLGDPDADPGDAPPHVVENGWPWPPRMGAESFISHGVFAAAEDADAYARLNGVVLGAERWTVAATGQDIVVARVRTAGFEADLCVPAGELPALPRPGNVVGGTVYLVASMPVPDREPQ